MAFRSSTRTTRVPPSPRRHGTQSAATTSQLCFSASAAALTSASMALAAGYAMHFRGILTPLLSAGEWLRPLKKKKGMWYYHHAALRAGGGCAPAIAPSAMAQVLRLTLAPLRRSTRHPLGDWPAGSAALLHATGLRIVAGHPFVELGEVVLVSQKGAF